MTRKVMITQFCFKFPARRIFDVVMLFAYSDTKYFNKPREPIWCHKIQNKGENLNAKIE